MVPVFPPWQRTSVSETELITGFGFTTRVLLAEVIPHEPPAVVNVKVTGVEEDVDAV